MANYVARANTKRAAVLFVSAAVLVVMSLIMFGERTAKDSFFGESHYRYTSESREKMGYFAGGALVAAGLFTGVGVVMLRCGLRLYDDHVEGIAYNILFNKQFSLPWSNVQSVGQFSGGVEIVSSGQKYKIMCSDADAVVRQLQRYQAGDLPSDRQRSPAPAVQDAPPPAPRAVSGLPEGGVVCPKCGTRQNAEREKCYMCETPLKGE